MYLNSLPNDLRVVVADDEDTNLYILMKSMGDSGYYNTKGFDSGLAVWNYLQENPESVDLVILDKMMYDLGGLEIIRRMKNHPILQHVPVMMQSGDIDVDEALDAGADRYLMKPFSSRELINVVSELTSVTNWNKRVYC